MRGSSKDEMASCRSEREALDAAAGGRTAIMIITAIEARRIALVPFHAMILY